jgi:hypothetical protein
MLLGHGTKPPGKIATNPEVLGFRTFVNDFCVSNASQTHLARDLTPNQAHITPVSVH